MRPKISTSFRPHGKWGDFLAAIIPGIWCLNILTNSNFILRLVEWQAESSLFTVRVRGRQWYWVYKYELKSIMEVLSTPKNVGRSKWFFSFFGDLSIEENYLQSLKKRRTSQWVKDYWTKISQKLESVSNESSYFLNQILKDENKKKNDKLFLSNFFFNTQFKYTKLYKNFYFKNFEKNNSNASVFFKDDIKLKNNSLFLKLKRIEKNVFAFDSYNQNHQQNIILFFKQYLKNKKKKNFFFYKPKNVNELSESAAPLKKNNTLASSTRILKKNFKYENEYIQEKIKNNLFVTCFSNGSQEFQEKKYLDSTFLVIKQKRYTIKNKLKPYFIEQKKKKKIIKFSGRSMLLNNSILDEFIKKPSSTHKIIKKNKIKSQELQLPLSKRLLRTKRTLVLPAQLNITVITNSFDVVHSWYIPGLGVKLDCVPGRSTHHTFYVDSIGFYFGQCAEICGRFHHHMPIKICALPFEHFLVWWNTFGISKVTMLDFNSKKKKMYTQYKYTW